MAEHKILIHPEGRVLAVLPSDHKWGKRDLEICTAKDVSLTETQVSDCKHGKMKIDGAGKLGLRPEEEWPETIQAKQEREAELVAQLQPKLEGVDESVLRAVDDLLAPHIIDETERL